MDKIEPVSGGGEIDHPQETVGQLIVTDGDGPVPFQATGHAFDAIALLLERPVMLGFRTAVRPAGYDSLDLPLGKVGADSVGIVALIGQHRLDPVANQAQQDQEALCVMRLTRREREAERAASGVAAGMDFRCEPTTRAPERFCALSPLFMPTAQ